MVIDSLATVDPYYLSDPELEEMEAPSETEVPSDDDWSAYFEATHVDPVERLTCCSTPIIAARRLCGCGGYPQP